MTGIELAPETTDALPWTLQRAPQNYVIGHVRAVLPDRVLDDARIVVRDGRIAEVGPSVPGVRADVDGGGLLCLPGSSTCTPTASRRNGCRDPASNCLVVRAHVVRGQGSRRRRDHGLPRRVVLRPGHRDVGPQRARRATHVRVHRAVVAARDRLRLVDHRVLHRLDVRSEAGFEAMRAEFERLVATGAVTTETPAVISHEDHTPGIGQYADRAYYENHIAGVRGISAEAARAYVDELAAEREANAGIRDTTMGWLAEQSRTGLVRIFGHDPESAVEIADLAARGGNVAEFPTTVEAAREARDRGMSVVMGGPNVLRGKSHSGNVSAGELADLGLVTALASDYLPSSLLGAAFVLAERGWPSGRRRAGHQWPCHGRGARRPRGSRRRSAR